MGTNGQAHKDEAEVVPAKSKTEQCPDEKEETESKADRKTVGLRCFQGNRETSEDEPSELGAAVVAASEPVFHVPQLISQPHYLDCDFDVEFTAEVRVEDGSSLALLTSITPNVGYQKPGSMLNGHFLLRPPLRNKRGSIDCFLPLGPNPSWCSGVIQALEQLPCSIKTSGRVIETAKSPLPSSPSNSPSSPSSAPSSPSSSPSSSSSSPGTNYHADENRGCAGDNRVSKGSGDFVSSTSSSLMPPSFNPSLHTSSSKHPSNDGQRQGVDNDIYDPFHPTEGEGEREQASSEDEEEEVDKYDPFEPTGSPASEIEEEKICMDEENEQESSINSEVNVMKCNRKLEIGPAAETETGPPDSTESVASSSVFNNVPLESNSKRSIKDRMKEQGKNRREIRADSEHSEIEEGEIVGASERGRERVIERRREVLLPASNSPSYLQGSGPKPERIIRVLEGDGFVSVCADEEWEREPVASVGVGDLRRKLTSRRKERFRSCPSSASISPSPAPVLPLPLPSSPFPTSPTLSMDKERSRKSSKSSKDRDRHKRKEGRGEKEKRKKRKEEKESGEGSRESREKDHGRENKEKDKDRDRERSSRSDSRKRKKRRQISPEHSSCSRSHNASRHAHSHRSWSSHSEEHHKDRDRAEEKERDRNRERDRDRDRWQDDRQSERDRDSKRDGQDRDEDSRWSSSRERGSAKRSSDRRDREKEMVRDRERDRRRESRPVVPPSIQDLNGADLFAIKRTITVTTTTTTTTVPGSPPHSQRRSRSRSRSSDKHHKRKKKRRRRSDDEERKEEEHRSRSRPTSLTPPRYHEYESDRPEVDMLSLDGEALDSDYPSLEDSPLLPPPPEPPLPSPKVKSTPPKSSRHHLKKKSRSGKKAGLSESTSSSSSHRPKAKSKNVLSSLSPPLSASPGNTTSLQPTASSSTIKRGRKIGKEKAAKKDAGRSGRSKKLGGSSRKGKLQSKVSVLVREGVSSTTGNSGKLGIDLLGPGGVVSGASGPSVVGGSIAVVFRRDNESRSPFLKPCSETLTLPGRSKDLSKTGKQRNILGPPSTASPSGLKSKKAKPSSATSTSSSASSPTSSLATKRRRRPGKKTREKGLTVDGSDAKNANSNCSMVGGGWGGGSAEMQPLVGVGPKPSSPPSALPGPTPSSSSSSSTSSSASILPPSSSPPHTSPLSLPPSRDTRESSPDSQTVDSSCKTPEPSFLSEECPGQSKPSSLTPSKSPSSPPSLLSSQIRGESISQSTTNAKAVPADDQKASPPCSSSSSASVSASLSHSSAPLANDPSSSSSSSVSSSSVSKPPPPPPPPPSGPPLPWSLQTGVDCTAGGVLALTALLFKMEEANIASRAKAQEFIQATSQILSQANQNQSQPHPPSSSSSVSSQVPPPPSHGPPPGPAPAQFILHSSVPLVGCTKTPPSHLLPGLTIGGGCAQTPPPPLPTGMSGVSGGSSETGWDSESKDPDKYLKKLHTQERAVEEVKLAIKPYYQRKDINKDEYKDILRKAVHKICHSRTGEINPVKVSNLVKLYVQRYKYFRKHGRKMDEEEKEDRESASMHSST